MSINYYVETKGNYSLHVEQWCDGGTWVTKKNSEEALDVRNLFKELVKKEQTIEKLECESTESAEISDMDHTEVEQLKAKVQELKKDVRFLLSFSPHYNFAAERVAGIKEKL
jgi:protein subunit release factor A